MCGLTKDFEVGFEDYAIFINYYAVSLRRYVFCTSVLDESPWNSPTKTTTKKNYSGSFVYQ